MLRSDLCDYSDAYIIVKGRISLAGTSNANKRNKKLSFKNNVLFRLCILEINITSVDNAKGVDIVTPMLEYNDNYSITFTIIIIIIIIIIIYYYKKLLL